MSVCGPREVISFVMRSSPRHMSAGLLFYDADHRLPPLEGTKSHLQGFIVTACHSAASGRDDDAALENAYAD